MLKSLCGGSGNTIRTRSAKLKKLKEFHFTPTIAWGLVKPLQYLDSKKEASLIRNSRRKVPAFQLAQVAAWMFPPGGLICPTHTGFSFFGAGYSLVTRYSFTVRDYFYAGYGQHLSAGQKRQSGKGPAPGVFKRGPAAGYRGQRENGDRLSLHMIPVYAIHIFNSSNVSLIRRCPCQE